MKYIYVNKEGVICACTVPFPNEKDFSGDQWKENAALQSCKNSAVPFEEQKDAKEILLPKHLFPTVPDTFYQIEADWEIVEIMNHRSSPTAASVALCKVARLRVPAPTVATDNSGKPDFEQMAKDFSSNQSHLTYIKCGPRCINNVDHDFVDHTLAIRSWYKQGLECIWNTHVLPLQKLVRSKNKSIKEAYECLKHPSVPLSAAIKILRKAKESEPSPVEEEQNKLWKELIDLYDIQDASSYGYGVLINKLSEKFILTRKS